MTVAELDRIAADYAAALADSDADRVRAVSDELFGDTKATLVGFCFAANEATVTLAADEAGLLAEGYNLPGKPVLVAGNLPQADADALNDAAQAAAAAVVKFVLEKRGFQASRFRWRFVLLVE
jgi:hypothetical protein